MNEHYDIASRLWRDVIIPDFSSVRRTGRRPNDDATKIAGPARSQHTQVKRVGVSVSRPAAMSEVGYLRLG